MLCELMLDIYINCCS